MVLARLTHYDRGQAEAKCLRPRPRPRPCLWGKNQGRGQNFGFATNHLGLDDLTSLTAWIKLVHQTERCVANVLCVRERSNDCGHGEREEDDASVYQWRSRWAAERQVRLLPTRETRWNQQPKLHGMSDQRPLNDAAAKPTVIILRSTQPCIPPG